MPLPSGLKAEVGLGSHIPPELFPLIIHHVRGYLDLKACSLVSHSWRKYAQPNIFSHIGLSRSEHCDAWNRKFDDHPHLATAVTSLYIYGGYLESMHGIHPFSNNQEVDHLVYDCTIEHDEAKKLLARLPNVVDVELEDFTFWEEVSKESLRCCLKLRSLKLTKMCEMAAIDFIELVQSIPNLRSLAITDIDLHLKGAGGKLIALQQAIPDTHLVQRLEDLSLDHICFEPDLVMWLLSPRFQWTGLRQADLWWASSPPITTGNTRAQEKPHAQPLAELITAIAPCVTILSLNIQALPDDILKKSKRDVFLQHVVETGALFHFESLQTLVLKDRSSVRIVGNASVAGLDICTLLLYISAPSMHQITIHLVISPSPERDLALPRLTEWETLDGLLSGAEFPALRRVIIAFRLYEDEGLTSSRLTRAVEREDAIDAMTKCLPLLVTSDRLRFDFDDMTIT